jgi:hypothetical protein
MTKKTFDEIAKEMIEKHRDLLDDLANSLLCPSCKAVVRPPFYNLGEDYNWAEGCGSCYDTIKKKEGE